MKNPDQKTGVQPKTPDVGSSVDRQNGGHIRLLSVVPVELEELLKELQKEIEA